MQTHEIDQVSYALMLGTPIDLEQNGIRSMVYEYPHDLTYVQHMLTLRRHHGRFFYDGTYMDTTAFRVHSSGPVHYARHEAENGDDLLVIINRSDKDAAVEILPEKNYSLFRVVAGYGKDGEECGALLGQYHVGAHDVLVVECVV